MAESVSKADVTGLLRAWRNGGGSADDRLIHAVEGDGRQAHIVELRYFGGLTEEETARATDLSPATIRSEVASPRLFLGRKMKGC